MTEFAGGGVHPRIIQQCAGHTSLATTHRYIEVTRIRSAGRCGRSSSELKGRRLPERPWHKVRQKMPRRPARMVP